MRVHLWPCFSCTYMMSHRLTCLVCACSGTLCIEGHVLARQHMRRLKEAMLGRATGDCVCVCARQSERETVSRGPCVIYCSPQIKQPGIHTPRQLQTHLKSLKKVLKIKHSFRHTFPLFYTILFPVLCAWLQWKSTALSTPLVTLTGLDKIFTMLPYCASSPPCQFVVT